MSLSDIKLYVMNAGALGVTTFTQIEDGLKILLLVITIGYTVSKWINIKKDNKMAYKQSPLFIKEEAYEASNQKMRKENPGMGKRLTSGTDPRRVSFACRFAGMKGAMKEANGEPTKKAMALKKWGFGSVEAARNFCQKNKSKK